MCNCTSQSTASSATPHGGGGDVDDGKLGRMLLGRLQSTRLTNGDDKATILRAVDRTRRVLPLRSVLRVIGLSSTRYTA